MVELYSSCILNFYVCWIIYCLYIILPLKLQAFFFFFFPLMLILSLQCIEGWFRGFIADYGVPLMVLVWTGVSYIPVNEVPQGIPRRLFSPNPWSPGAYSNWTVIKVVQLIFLSWISSNACRLKEKCFFPDHLLRIFFHISENAHSKSSTARELK